MNALTDYLRFDNGLAESTAPDETIYPLMIVSQAEYDSFADSLLPHQQDWLNLHGSKGKSGSIFTLPDAQGQLAMGVVITGRTPQWDSAKAARTLPACTFIANTDFAGSAALSDIQLGWGLAQYEFAPHKNCLLYTSPSPRDS